VNVEKKIGSSYCTALFELTAVEEEFSWLYLLRFAIVILIDF